MSKTPASVDPVTKRLLDGVAGLIAATPFCWLTTQGESGGVSARPMGRISPHPQKTDWSISFVTNRRSRKFSEMRRVERATLVFDGTPRDQFAALSGIAVICDGADERERRWKPEFDQFFPTQLDRQDAVFIDVSVDRMELWIKGVTPEPFGRRATILIRNADGGWRSQPDPEV